MDKKSENKFEGRGFVARSFYGDPLAVEGRNRPVEAQLEEMARLTDIGEARRMSGNNPFWGDTQLGTRLRWINSTQLTQQYWMEPGPMKGGHTLQVLARGQLDKNEFIVEQVCVDARSLVMVVMEIESGEKESSFDKGESRKFDEIFMKALEMMKIADFSGAVDAFDQAERVNPAAYGVFINRALCRVLNDDPVGARKDLMTSFFILDVLDKGKNKKLISRILSTLGKLSHAEAREALFKAYDDGHEAKFLESIDFMRRSVDLDTTNYEAKFLLAYFYAEFGYSLEAYELLVDLLKVRPEYAAKVVTNPFLSDLCDSLKKELNIEFD